MDMSSNPLFFKFILPASFIYSKNHINLAKAILLIKRKYGINNIRISCFGSYIDKIDKNGIKFSSSYLELVNFIQANGIEEFFQINKPIPNLYEFYPHYDALVLPSFYEGCPNAVIEGKQGESLEAEEEQQVEESEEPSMEEVAQNEETSEE